MSGGWIKFEKVLESDPRVRRIARELRNACVTLNRISSNDAFFTHAFFVSQTLGCLGRLWFYADTHIRQDDTLELTIDDINEIVGVQDFAQILPEDWLEILDAETVKLPGFHSHNGTIAKKKAQTAKRVSKHRERVTLQSLKSERRCNSSALQNALQDQDQDQDQDQEKEYIATSPRRAATVSRETDPAWFLEFKLAYPDRAGAKNWRGALMAANARLTEGHSPSEFLTGAAAYATFCQATDKTDTEFVMQASRFLGPGKPFLDDWSPPATKADNRLRSNLSAAEEFMRRTEPGEAA